MIGGRDIQITFTIPVKKKGNMEINVQRQAGTCVQGNARDGTRTKGTAASACLARVQLTTPAVKALLPFC